MEELNENQFDEIDPCIMGFLFWLSNLIVRIERCCYQVYSCNDIVKGSIDNISYCTTWSCNSLHKKRTVPNEKIWGSSCKLSNNQELIEEFVYENTSALHIEPFNFLIYHRPDYILCSCSSIIERNSIPLFSEIRFLSIEYTHPDMDQSIQLVLEKEWSVVGNEVLGKIHVLRMLEYQVSEGFYMFDERYVLKMIDSNIHLLELRAGQYIQLGEKDYIIIG